MANIRTTHTGLSQLKLYVRKDTMEFKLSKQYFGFFSDSFRLLQTYMICKLNNVKLYIKSEGWPFLHNLGWNDWFTTLDTTDKQLPDINCDDSSDRRFTVLDYKNAIKEVFMFQPYLHELADKVTNQLELGDSYVSIFIRRGDKLIGESIFIPSYIYVELALSKNPSVIFVQTDDYRAVEEVRELVRQKNENIRVVSTCPQDKNGFFYYPIGTHQLRSFQYNLENGTSLTLNDNVKYIESTPPQKHILKYTKEEIKIHVEEMIVGLILCQRSRYLVLDNMSNTSRYLIFSHNLGKDGILLLEDLNLAIAENIRLLPAVDYSDDKYISNPRYHCIHNNYT